MLLLALKTLRTPIICAMDTINNADVGFNDDSEDDALFDDIALLATQGAIPGFDSFLTQSVEDVVSLFPRCFAISIDNT